MSTPHKPGLKGSSSAKNDPERPSEHSGDTPTNDPFPLGDLSSVHASTSRRAEKELVLSQMQNYVEVLHLEQLRSAVMELSQGEQETILHLFENVEQRMARTSDPAASAEIESVAQQTLRMITAITDVGMARLGTGVTSDFIETVRGALSQSFRFCLDDVAVVEPLRVLMLGFQSSFLDEGGELVDSAAAFELGVRLGKQAAAATTWHGRVGASLDTESVTQLLGVTRQALDSRKRTGSVLALSGVGTTYYPSWQFDMAEAKIRPVTLRIVNAFREAVEDIDPHTIAAWAMSPQPELEGRTPAEWISHGGEAEPVVLAARRAALLEAL